MRMHFEQNGAELAAPKKGVNKMDNYTFYSTKPAGKIQVGDLLKTEKGKQTKITDLYRHQGETVFVTDRFGLVFENEIEVKGKMQHV